MAYVRRLFHAPSTLLPFCTNAFFYRQHPAILMPKPSSKEIVEDSEEEQVKPNRKFKNKTRGSRGTVGEEEKKREDNNSNEDENEKAEQDEDEGDEGDEGEGGGEEYEIEAIIKAQANVFDGGRLGYLVRWKGYGSEHDSWVTESDAENAGELIQLYWRKQKKTPREVLQSSKSSRGRPRKSDEKATSGQKRKKSDSIVTPARKRAPARGNDDDDEAKVEDDEIEEIDEPPKPTKRAKTSSRNSSAKNAGAENGASEYSKPDSPEAEDNRPVSDYRPADEELATKKSWEKIVKTVDTIENLDGELKVFFTLNNGDKVFASSRDCKERFPQKLIQFYESNLRWREVD